MHGISAIQARRGRPVKPLLYFVGGLTIVMATLPSRISQFREFIYYKYRLEHRINSQFLADALMKVESYEKDSQLRDIDKLLTE